ncbi:MAG: signal peptidase II [Phycisphaerales bacterium]|nr:signal peptidase II [Phycisphaerales bacterium]
MTSAPDDRRAWSSPACWVVLLLVVAIGLWADLWTKSYAFETVAGQPVEVARHALLDNPGYNPIPPHPGVVLIPGRILNLQLVLNSGAVFGIGSEQRGFFIVFTVIAILVSTYIFGWQTGRRSTMAHLGIALVLAGALGNLWDRLMVGRVRDFLYLFPDRHLPFGLNWPGGGSEVFPWVFNIADVLLLTGMGILLIHLYRSDRQQQQAAKGQENPAAEP